MANVIHPLVSADYIMEQALVAAAESAVAASIAGASDAVDAAVALIDFDTPVAAALLAADVALIVTAASEPAVGDAGTLFVNSTDSTVHVSNGAAWIPVITATPDSAVLVGSTTDTEPAPKIVGTIWVKADGSVHMYNGTAWKELASAT